MGVRGNESEKMTINIEFHLRVQPVKSEVNNPTSSSSHGAHSSCL